MAWPTASLGFSCVGVGARTMEVCVFFEQENFCAWGTWRSVAWPPETSALEI